jgi:hypothetical protein
MRKSGYLWFVIICLISLYIPCRAVTAQNKSDSLKKNAERVKVVTGIDTSKNNPKDSTLRIPFSVNKIKNVSLIQNGSDTIGYDKFIWTGKRNLGEILDVLPGFFVNTFGTAGRTAISYNSLAKTGFFRDGIQINDMLYGGFDAEVININEIERIELISAPMSFLYGTDIYGKSVNVITKDRFQPNIFSQLRMSLDRDDAAYADFFFNFPFSRKMNFIIGISNHSSDGHYTNSDFSLWRGRIKLNYFPSDKVNIKFSFYPQKFERGLNEGLLYSTKDTLLDPKLAQVVNSDSYEKISNYYYDIQFIGNFFRDSLSLTKFTVSAQNSLREYRDEENRTNPNGIYIKNDRKSVTYSLNLRQDYRFRLNNNISAAFQAGGNASFNAFDNSLQSVYFPNYADTVKYGTYNFFSRFDLFYKNFSLSGGLKAEHLRDNNYFDYGAEAKYSFGLFQDADVTLNLGGFTAARGFDYETAFLYFPTADGIYYNGNTVYYELGASVRYKNLILSVLQYNNSAGGVTSPWNGNYTLRFVTNNFDLSASLNRYQNSPYPLNVFKSDVSYNNCFFKNKLNLKTGFIIKYSSGYYGYEYSQFTNNFITSYSNNVSNNNFNLDFYVGARVGKANLNLTLANLLNNLNYDTYIYPWENRGGLLNVVSRLTVTWDFWN